jgi:hypothetical protein
MSNVEVIVWKFTPGAGACGKCVSMKGIHLDKPKRPHPNCKCDITWSTDYCTLEHTFFITYPTGETHEKIVGFVQPGGNTSVKYNTKHTNKRQLGAKSGINKIVDVGISSERGETTEKGIETKQEFVHNPQIDSGAQKIVNIYEEYVTETHEEWDCTRNGRQRYVSYSTESRLVRQEQRPI